MPWILPAFLVLRNREEEKGYFPPPAAGMIW